MTMPPAPPASTPPARKKGDGRDVLEFFTEPTFRPGIDWKDVLNRQHCHYIGKTCAKRRKSDNSIVIGTCTVTFDVKAPKPLIICPFRFLERKQVFMDCIGLLTRRATGDELHVVSEVTIPGGSVDYCLVAVRKGRVVDFVGIELQAVDTTGSVWPTRQRFLNSHGLAERVEDDGYGMNWKMSAKTILVQLHHKVETFEHVGRHFVLVVQNHFLDQMIGSFSFDHIGPAKVGDTMHFHSYSLVKGEMDYRLEFDRALSTDSQGVQKCLGVAAEVKVEEAEIIRILEEKIRIAIGSKLLTVTTGPGVSGNDEEAIPEVHNKPGLLEE